MLRQTSNRRPQPSTSNSSATPIFAMLVPSFAAQRDQPPFSLAPATRARQTYVQPELDTASEIPKTQTQLTLEGSLRQPLVAVPLVRQRARPAPPPATQGPERLEPGEPLAGAIPIPEKFRLAARGAQGAGIQLPFLDRIQQAFGRYDVRSARAYTGLSATASSDALGAEAYAMQGKVVFRQPRPDLHTVAHEAAHLVQQRAGLRPPGNIGLPGDQYERHANAVADRVVRGSSAESVLKAGLGGAGSTLSLSVPGPVFSSPALQAQAKITGSIDSSVPFTGMLQSLSASNTSTVAIAPAPIWAPPRADGTASSFDGKWIMWEKGTKPLQKPDGWDKFVALVGPYAVHNIIQGHLLNEHLGGPGEKKNLTPLTKSANKVHSSEVEEEIKDYVQGTDKKKRLLDKGKRAHYEVIPNYTSSPGPSQQALVKKIEEEREKNEENRKTGSKSHKTWVREYVEKTFPESLTVKVIWIKGDPQNNYVDYQETPQQVATITNEPA